MYLLFKQTKMEVFDNFTISMLLSASIVMLKR